MAYADLTDEQKANLQVADAFFRKALRKAERLTGELNAPLIKTWMVEVFDEIMADAAMSDPLEVIPTAVGYKGASSFNKTEMVAVRDTLKNVLVAREALDAVVAKGIGINVGSGTPEPL